MTRAELLERLDYLENHDPRRDPRHVDCSVWIWERDELIRAQTSFNCKDRKESLAQPPLGENSLKAQANLRKSVEDTALLIAVELTEKDYTVERWPEYWAQGRLWGCIISHNGGRTIPIRVRVSQGMLTLCGQPDQGK